MGVHESDILAFLNGMAVEKVSPTPGDVHAPGTGDKPPAAAAETKKPEDDAEVAKRADILKRIEAVDAVFSKGEANLYIHRPLKPESAARLVEYAEKIGVKNIVPAELMHATQAHSKAAIDTSSLKPLETVLDIDTNSRWLGYLGKDGKALVMFFRNQPMQDRFKELSAAGASWDFPSFITHITLSYDAEGSDLTWEMPPDMPLLLGPEVWAASNDNWTKENGLAKGEFITKIAVSKVIPEQRMIFGWASVATVNGVEVIDKQGDIIPIVELEKAAYEFTLYSRQHGDMHARIGTGLMVESMVFTAEKRALGIVAKNEKGELMEGWWTGFRVDDPKTWEAHKRGELPEFSIGGKATPVPA